MNSEMKGLLAVEWKLRVTKDPMVYEKFAMLPCQAGWKQKDESWENEYFTVKTFSQMRLFSGIKKGDWVFVSGRVIKERRGEFLNWVIYADNVRTLYQGCNSENVDSAKSTNAVEQMDEAPF